MKKENIFLISTMIRLKKNDLKEAHKDVFERLRLKYADWEQTLLQLNAINTGG